jgi:hypothetical protein
VEKRPEPALARLSVPCYETWFPSDLYSRAGRQAGGVPELDFISGQHRASVAHVISVSGLTLLPAGEQRLLEAQRRGEKGFGESLPLREVSTDDAVTVRVYLVAPVEGGRDERHAYYEIQVGL